MEDYAIVSRKTEEQLRKFLGGFSPHLSKPRLKFLGDMLYGVQAAGDVKLSEIARELRPGSGCSPKKKEERLSRHLEAEDLTGVVGGGVLADACRYVDEDTLVVVDPTDLQKRYARRMEGLSKVYDGSRGDVGEGLGHTGVMAVASTCTTVAGTTRSCSASTASWAWTSSSSRRRISPASGWDGA